MVMAFRSAADPASASSSAICTNGPVEDSCDVYGDCTGSSARSSVRSDHAARCMVDSTCRRGPRVVHFSDLFGMGGVPGGPLRVRSVSFALLLSRDLRRLAAQLVRAEAGKLAVVAAVLARTAHSAHPRPIQ